MTIFDFTSPTRRPPRKSGLTPKTTMARVVYMLCNHSIASMVFGVNSLFLEGFQITLSLIDNKNFQNDKKYGFYLVLNLRLYINNLIPARQSSVTAVELGF